MRLVGLLIEMEQIMCMAGLIVVRDILHILPVVQNYDVFIKRMNKFTMHEILVLNLVSISTV